MTRPALRPRAAPGALLMCAVVLPLLSGCTLYNRVFHRGRTSASCHETVRGQCRFPAGTQGPGGLSAPDTRNAIKVPAIGADDRQPAKSEPCLAQPPNFFAKPLLPGSGKPVAPAPAAPATPATATPAPAPTVPAPTAQLPDRRPPPAAPVEPQAIRRRLDRRFAGLVVRIPKLVLRAGRYGLRH